MREYQTRIQRVLDEALNQTDIPERLRESMRYSALSGGKRFRALLVYAAGLSVDAPLEKLDVVAIALECIHAYSLIHDDLPAMDDDDLRRGQATNHIKFDDATAILAGDGLLTFAFELINGPDSPLTDQQCRKISHLLANNAGPIGMVGGQMLDIQATGLNESKNTNQQTSLNELENIHRRKTGALIKAATLCGAYCSESVSSKQIGNLNDYATSIGLAFQVVDDILDIESSTEELGKPSGADIELGKATYPALIGLEESKEMAENLYQEAMVSLTAIGDNTRLFTTEAKGFLKEQAQAKSFEEQAGNNTAMLKSLADLVIKRRN